MQVPKLYDEWYEGDTYVWLKQEQLDGLGFLMSEWGKRAMSEIQNASRILETETDLIKLIKRLELDKSKVALNHCECLRFPVNTLGAFYRYAMINMNVEQLSIQQFDDDERQKVRNRWYQYYPNLLDDLLQRVELTKKVVWLLIESAEVESINQFKTTRTEINIKKLKSINSVALVVAEENLGVSEARFRKICKFDIC